MNHFRRTISVLIFILACIQGSAYAQNWLNELDKCNITWKGQSKNASESMPVGGGDIGLNVWVENNELLFYIARSGTFDETNALLKLGRVRIRLSPNPFEGKDFQQQLALKNGDITITALNGKLRTSINVWVDVFSPTIHVTINCNRPVTAEAIYESWRHKDRPLTGRAGRATSYKWEIPAGAKTHKDEINFDNNSILFLHRNNAITVFDSTVKHEGMEAVKAQLFDPLGNLTFGGKMMGSNMVPAGETNGVYVNTDFKGWKLKSRKASRLQAITIHFHTAKVSSLQLWKDGLENSIKKTKAAKNPQQASRKWWKDFWQRSYIYIHNSDYDSSDVEQAGRNYQLMRYMLACNAFGDYPTKFNGGLFTYDPVFVDSSHKFTPDFRNWGGGTHTAQNQRLVYFPMIKSGDWDLMKSQFDFYLRILSNAELRSKVYWNHEGACFTEQMENFGLPNMVEYGMRRPANYDKGVEYNAWLEYQWDTVLEFCLMMLEVERYNKQNISEYIPFIESCLKFFDQHYQYRAKQRGTKALNGKGHLVLYPGSGAETFKMAYNASSTIAALQTITRGLLELPSTYLNIEKRKEFEEFLKRIPPISFAQFDGKKTIAPAQSWERINNSESPQLYPVYPWGIYGVGKPDLDVARNTFLLDTNVLKFTSHVGWKQDNIFAARLGLSEEASRLTLLKLRNAATRFPAFWGPGFDWTPDHNWGGSGMIGLQEMLMQEHDEKIYLFPAWPKQWNVHFKLHAPYQTTVEVVFKNGKVEKLEVVPAQRKKDVINMLDHE